MCSIGMEALIQGGMELGLTQEQAKELAVQTFAGAAALAQASGEQPEVLRQQVTSKGGTTHAAISSMQGKLLRMPTSSRPCRPVTTGAGAGQGICMTGCAA